MQLYELIIINALVTYSVAIRRIADIAGKIRSTDEHISIPYQIRKPPIIHCIFCIYCHFLGTKIVKFITNLNKRWILIK